MSLSSIAGSQRLKTRRVGKNTGTHGKRNLFLLPEICSLPGSIKKGFESGFQQ